MRKWILFGATLATVALLPEVSAFAQAVVAAAPVPTEAVKDSLWWQDLANAGITAVTGFIAVAIPVVGTFLVSFLRSRSKLASALVGNALVERMEKGAIGILNAEAEKVRLRLGLKNLDMADPEVRSEIVDNASDRFATNFKESLQHFGQDRQSSVTNFLLGRLDQVVPAQKPTTPVPFVQSR